MPQIVAANRALDGVRVFLTANGQWAESAGEAAIFDMGEVQDALFRARSDAERLVVVEPYVTALQGGDRRAPVHLRGLTVRPAAAE